YPGVTAATLRALDGQARAASKLAFEALRALEECGEDSYYAAATQIELALVLRDTEAAQEAILRARDLNDGDYSALASTRRQLKLLINATGDSLSLLDPLRGPAVVHYAGHRIGRRFPARDEAFVADQIARELELLSPGFGYGALANGGDILVAEELLRRGAELHVVLPFARD